MQDIYCQYFFKVCCINQEANNRTHTYKHHFNDTFSSKPGLDTQISIRFLPDAVNCVRFCFWRRQSAFLFVYEISRELLNEFVPNSHRRRVWSLARMSLKVKVKGQGHQGQKMAFFGPFGGLHAAHVW